MELVARQNREESLNITWSICRLQRNISASDATAEPENHGGRQIPTRGQAICEQSARAEGRAGEWNAAPQQLLSGYFQPGLFNTNSRSAFCWHCRVVWLHFSLISRWLNQ